MKSAVDIDAIAKKYGGSVSTEDIAKKYGGTVEDAAAAPAAQTQRVGPPAPPPELLQGVGIRPPLTPEEKRHLRQQDVSQFIHSLPERIVNALPTAGAVGGAMLFSESGGVPGAVGGAAFGESLKKSLQKRGIGAPAPTPPPQTFGEYGSQAWQDIKDIAGEGAKAGLGQYIGGTLIPGALRPSPFTQPLARTEFHNSVHDITNAMLGDNATHVEVDRFRNSAANAIDHLKRAETDLGTKVRDIRDATVVGKKASQDVWAPYQQLLDSTQSRITKNDLLAAADAEIPNDLKTSQATVYDATKKRWDRQLGKADYGAGEIEKQAQADNVRLKNIYKRDNIDRAAAEKDPRFAFDEALLRARRKLLDQKIIADTGVDPAPYRQTYGHVKAVTNAFMKSPSDDDTLWQVVRTTGTPTSKSEAGSYVKRLIPGQMNPDKLVSRAFKNWDLQSPTYGLPPGWQPPTPQVTVHPPLQVTMHPPQVPAPTALPPGPSPTLQGTPLGQKLLPGPGGTTYPEVQTPKSLLDINRENFMPESRIARQQAATAAAPPRPANAKAYLQQLAGKPVGREHILADSNFQMLSDGERLKVMHEVDPTWRKLDPTKRWKVISEPPRPPE